jgi:hypothetical protein
MDQPPDLDATGRPVTGGRPPDLDASGHPMMANHELRASTAEPSYRNPLAVAGLVGDKILGVGRSIAKHPVEPLAGDGCGWTWRGWWGWTWNDGRCGGWI